MSKLKKNHQQTNAKNCTKSKGFFFNTVYNVI